MEPFTLVRKCVGFTICEIFLIYSTPFPALLVIWAFRERDRYLHPHHGHLQLTDYSLVNGLIALLTPHLLFGACFCSGGILQYVTSGAVKMRNAIPLLLRGVKLRNYKKRLYWELEETFYYRITVVKASSPLWQIDTAVSSWMLWTIVVLSLQLCFTYFFDQTIVDYKYSLFCLKGYDCFPHQNITHPLSHAECDHLTDFYQKGVHCFRFARLRHHEDVIGSLSKTFAFYLFLMALFNNIFRAAKLLLLLRRCKWWGMLFVIGGFGTCVAVVVLAAVWNDLLLLVNVVSYIQIMYGAVFCVVIGVLVLKTKWRDDFGIPQDHDFNAQGGMKTDHTEVTAQNQVDSVSAQNEGIRKRTTAEDTGNALDDNRSFHTTPV